MQQVKVSIRMLTYNNPTDNSIELKSLCIQHNRSEYFLEGQIGDSIYVFTESIATYVLSVNRSIGKITLNAYMAPEADPIATVPLYTPEEIEELVGLNWESEEPLAIATKLINCLI